VQKGSRRCSAVLEEIELIIQPGAYEDSLAGIDFRDGQKLAARVRINAQKMRYLVRYGFIRDAKSPQRQANTEGLQFPMVDLFTGGMIVPLMFVNAAATRLLHRWHSAHSKDTATWS
jgi:hypothetical protein